MPSPVHSPDTLIGIADLLVATSDCLTSEVDLVLSSLREIYQDSKPSNQPAHMQQINRLLDQRNRLKTIKEQLTATSIS
jgi:hypothetical protein